MYKISLKHGYIWDLIIIIISVKMQNWVPPDPHLLSVLKVYLKILLLQSLSGYLHTVSFWKHAMVPVLWTIIVQ